MTEETKKRIAELAATAERDIDEGRIKLTGEAADRELARLAEQKRARLKALERPAPTPPHAAYTAPVGASFCCGNECPGLSFRATPQTPHPETCLAVGQTHGDEETPRTQLTELVEGLLGKETPESRAAIEGYFPAAAVNVDVPVPVGFVPTHVYTNRTTKAVTFNGGELRRTLQHSGPVAFPTEAEADSLAFCFRIALEHDHGGAQKLRRLLYAWHNGRELGGFDFADLWSFDETYLKHALTVINMIARSPVGWYAEHYGYGADMIAIIEQHHPSGGDRRRQ